MAGQRQIPPADLQIEAGILDLRSARGAKGRWIEGDNVRWRDGLPEKHGGFVEETLTDIDDNPLFYEGRARACHEWDSLDSQNWIAVGTHCKLYLINNERLYDITPLRYTSTIINGFTTTAGSSLVTVTDAGHDCIDGSHVHYSGASAVGGITIDGEYEVVSVIDLDTYTIRHSSAATGSATGGGVVQAQYELNCGLESDGILDGFGTGDYGEETYGTPRANSTFGGSARVWALDNWGEDLLAAPNGESLYWWDRTTGPDSRAQLLTGAPTNMEFMLVGPDDRHVLAFGTNLLTGEQDKMFVRWCVGDDFNDWERTAETDAGSKRLDIGSQLITAVKTRSMIALWSDQQLYAVQFVGGTNPYDFVPLGRVQRIVSKNAAVDVDGVLYWMGEDDFFVYDGVINTLPCEIKDYVFGNKKDPEQPGIDRTNQSKVFCVHIREFNEVRWYFCSQDSDENDRCAIYNTDLKVWYRCSIRRECALDRNAFFGTPVGFYDERMFLDETGTDVDDEEALISFLESFEGEISAGALDMEVRKLIPDFKNLEGQIDVQLFGRNRPSDSRVYSRLVTITDASREIGLPFKKKQVGLRIESNQMGDDWRMDMWRHRTVPHGGR